MLYLLLYTYATVFLTELVGDKAFYTVGSLTARFHPLPVFIGITAAFTLKALVAVLVGQAISELPRRPVLALSAVTFFLTALVIWLRKRRADAPDADARRDESPRAALVSFGVIFLSEWGDVGQVAVATLTAQHQLPLVIWAGATLALATKGLLAITLGIGLKKFLPQDLLRVVSVGLCLALALISTLQLIAS